jgi:hypothetical protein
MTSPVQAPALSLLQPLMLTRDITEQNDEDDSTDATVATRASAAPSPQPVDAGWQAVFQLAQGFLQRDHEDTLRMIGWMRIRASVLSHVSLAAMGAGTVVAVMVQYLPQEMYKTAVIADAILFGLGGGLLLQSAVDRCNANADLAEEMEVYAARQQDNGN